MNVIDPRQPEDHLKRLLDESWHIFHADDLEDAYDHLLRRGHSEMLDWMIHASFEVPKDQLKDRLLEQFGEDSDAVELDEFVGNFGPAVEWMHEAGLVQSDADLLRGTSAFDIDRAIWLVRTALGAKYISRRTALDMVINAGDHARARFDSWREYGTSVLLGRAIWGGVDDPAGLFAERAKIVEMLLQDPRSTWVTAGWWPPMQEEDHEEGNGASESEEPGDSNTDPTVH